MSINSPIKSYSKSLNLHQMSEHITDSNILQSRRTYGSNKSNRSLSVSSESSGSFSATTSEDLKNDGVNFSDFNEVLYSERNFDLVTAVTNICNENINIQKEIIKSEINLFNEEDFDYFCEKEPDSSSISEVSSYGSNYQRTRKNLKNQLSSQQYASEEIYEATSCEDNLNFSTNSVSKSACDYLNPKQNSLVNEKPEHTKTNGIKSNSIIANDSGKISLFQNPYSNSKRLPILDLVNRFSASHNQTNAKRNQSNKRKIIKEESESVPTKKISTVIKCEKLSSTVSVKKYCKNDVLKSDISVNSILSPKKVVFKTPSKSVHKIDSRSNSTEKSTNLKYSDNNTSELDESDLKTSSKVKKKIFRSDDNAVGSRDMISSVSNKSRLIKRNVKTPSKKPVQKNNFGSVDNAERAIDLLKKFVSKNTPVKKCAATKIKRPLKSTDLNLVRNKTLEKIPSNNGDKQTEVSPFVQSQESSVQNQVLNNNGNTGLNYPLCMPMIIAPMPPSSLDGAYKVTPLAIWRYVPSITNNQSMQSNSHAVSWENPGPSILNYDHSGVKAIQPNMKYLETSEDMCVINNDATTIISTLDDKKCVFRPRTLLNDGVEFRRSVTDNLKFIKENCILHCKDQSSKIFLMDPAMLNITVRDFCNNPVVTDILLDYLTNIDMSESQVAHNTNKGYDFPENFEIENLLRVVYDFVHTTISLIIPTNKPMPLNLSYVSIMTSAIQKMSNREFVILMRLFKGGELYKLKDILARLSLAALLVIFDEYKNKRSR